MADVTAQEILALSNPTNTLTVKKGDIAATFLQPQIAFVRIDDIDADSIVIRLSHPANSKSADQPVPLIVANMSVGSIENTGFVARIAEQVKAATAQRPDIKTNLLEYDIGIFADLADGTRTTAIVSSAIGVHQMFSGGNSEAVLVNTGEKCAYVSLGVSQIPPAKLKGGKFGLLFSTRPDLAKGFILIPPNQR